jgi:hypothetical protein
MTEQNDTGVPADVDELVQFIASAVLDHHKKSGRPMDGSQLAYLIRTEFPSLEYGKLGLTRLGDAVRLAETSNLVRRNRDAKHLELSPANSNNQVLARQRPPPTDRKYIRSDVWKAFLHHQTSPIFFNKSTSQVVELDNGTMNRELPEPAGNLVEISPIPDEVKIGWARSFLQTTLGSDAVKDDEAKSLASGKHKTFDSATKRSWKLSLAGHVVNYIEKWAKTHTVPTDDILTPMKSRKELNESEPTSTQPNEIVALRRALIEAINEMPMEHLENLVLPVRYIRRHFSPKI